MADCSIIPANSKVRIGTPKKRVSSLTAHYSACLLHEAQASEWLEGISLVYSGGTSTSENGKIDDTADNIKQEAAAEESISVQDKVTMKEKLEVSDSRSCGCCQANFIDREDQTSHYRSDWHRYNLQRRLRGLPGVSEDAFEDMSGDVSSISGSDTEDSDQELPSLPPAADVEEVESEPTILTDRRAHKVFFTNSKGELVSVYRCLLHHKKHPTDDPPQLVAAASQLPSHGKWTVLMVSAGHFAGAVFVGKECLEHKTFHRYTVRAKRGTAQSSRDNKGNAPKSAGARLRRYNEAALTQEIQELMSSWNNHLSSSNLIFVRIPTNNRSTFYGGRNPILKKEDSRVRIIPFSTRRPTFNETKRVYQMLSSVECYGQESEVRDIIPRSPPRFYDKESDQLQVRDPRPPRQQKDKSIDRQKNGSSVSPERGDRDISSEREKRRRSSSLGRRQMSPAALNAVEEQSDTSPPEHPDCHLVESLETLSFSHLQEFSSTKKKNKKRKKQEKKEKEEDINSELDEDKIRWRNKLYTSCKTGNSETLLDTISAIKSAQGSILPAACSSLGMRKTQESSQCPDGNKDHSHDVSSLENKPGVSSLPQETNASTAILREGNTVQQHCDIISSTAVDPALTPDSGVSPDPLSTPDLVIQLLTSPLGDSRTTYLHLAARGGHGEIITQLLIHGADPTIREGSGQLAYNVASPECRNAFRRFMAAQPSRYDYAKAQVPSPLTEEMESERKAKMAEKRKQKKKAANERNKEKKAAEATERAEIQEQQRFLALSDREKVFED